MFKSSLHDIYILLGMLSIIDVIFEGIIWMKITTVLQSPHSWKSLRAEIKSSHSGFKWNICSTKILSEICAFFQKEKPCHLKNKNKKTVYSTAFYLWDAMSPINSLFHHKKGGSSVHILYFTTTNLLD